METGDLASPLSDAAARLQAAQAQLKARLDQSLAAARALIATHAAQATGGAGTILHLTTATPPEFRVFRHTSTGVCVVLRNVESTHGFECVLGPKAADGSPLSFDAAMEFSRQSLRQTVLKSITDQSLAETKLQDLEEVSAKISEPGFFGEPAKPAG